MDEQPKINSYLNETKHGKNLKGVPAITDVIIIAKLVRD